MPKHRGRAVSLLGENHFADGRLAVRLESVEIHTGRHLLAGVVGGVPLDGVLTGRQGIGDECPHPLADHVVHGQLNRPLTGHRESDLGGRVEGVGVVLEERELFRENPFGIRCEHWSGIVDPPLPILGDHIQTLGFYPPPVQSRFAEDDAYRIRISGECIRVGNGYPTVLRPGDRSTPDFHELVLGGVEPDDDTVMGHFRQIFGLDRYHDLIVADEFGGEGHPGPAHGDRLRENPQTGERLAGGHEADQ